VVRLVVTSSSLTQRPKGSLCCLLIKVSRQINEYLNIKIQQSGYTPRFGPEIKDISSAKDGSPERLKCRDYAPRSGPEIKDGSSTKDGSPERLRCRDNPGDKLRSCNCVYATS